MGKFTQLTKILHDRRSRRSRQISSLYKPRATANYHEPLYQSSFHPMSPEVLLVLTFTQEPEAQGLRCQRCPSPSTVREVSLSFAFSRCVSLHNFWKISFAVDINLVFNFRMCTDLLFLFLFSRFTSET